jgi:hypothetical protein
MPCMGPDLDYAAKIGNKVGQDILAKMIFDNSLMDCDNERWLVMKRKFIKVVEDLFVEDACNSF